MIRDRHDDRSVTTLVTDIEPRTPRLAIVRCHLVH